MARWSRWALPVIVGVMATLHVAVPPAQADPAIAVAVFGDSYSSGEGLQLVDPGEPQCQRALGGAGQSTAWGVQVARRWGAEPKWFAACTGAVSTNFNDTPQAGAGRTKTQLAEALAGSGLEAFDALTASFGGNDIDFDAKIYDCLGLESLPVAAAAGAGVAAGGWLVAPPVAGGYVAGAFARCSDDTDAAMRARIEEARGGLSGLYKQMARAVRPGGTIAIAGYPQILETVGDWPRINKALRRCQGIHIEDADKLNGINARLNQVIAEQVKQASQEDGGAHRWKFVDVTTGGFGPHHGLCGTEAAFLNGVTLVPRRERSFHPNQAGHDAYAQAVTAAVPAVERRPPKVTTTTAPSLDLTLDLTGLGPLRFGMTAAAATATRAASSYDSIEPSASCGFAGAGPLYKEGDFSLTYEDRRLVRFDVASSRIRSPHGIGIGSPSSKLSAVQGIRSEKPHHYNAGTTQIRFLKGAVGYQFDVRAGSIVAWAVGTPEALDLVEGCA